MPSQGVQCRPRRPATLPLFVNCHNRGLAKECKIAGSVLLTSRNNWTVDFKISE